MKHSKRNCGENVLPTSHSRIINKTRPGINDTYQHRQDLRVGLVSTRIYTLRNNGICSVGIGFPHFGNPGHHCSPIATEAQCSPPHAQFIMKVGDNLIYHIQPPPVHS